MWVGLANLQKRRSLKHFARHFPGGILWFFSRLANLQLKVSVELHLSQLFCRLEFILARHTLREDGAKLHLKLQIMNAISKDVHPYLR